MALEIALRFKNNLKWNIIFILEIQIKLLYLEIIIINKQNKIFVHAKSKQSII